MKIPGHISWQLDIGKPEEAYSGSPCLIDVINTANKAITKGKFDEPKERRALGQMLVKEMLRVQKKNVEFAR